jgi:hypothetical protein
MTTSAGSAYEGTDIVVANAASNSTSSFRMVGISISAD